MANDAYLQIDGIKGESTDSKHKEWIEVSNVDWHVHQPRALSISSSGHTNGKAELSEISFKKLADLSSPLLCQTCATGKTISTAKFEFMRADGNGEPIKYYTVEIENVMISSARFPNQHGYHVAIFLEFGIESLEVATRTSGCWTNGMARR